MDQKQLTLFVETAQFGSFQRAADHNFLSQRAVSKRIGALEEELGIDLFQRTKNKITLTAAGQHFLSRAEELLNTMHMARYEAQQVAQQTTNQLTVGYFSPFEGVLLHLALASLPETTDFIIEEKGIEHLISDVLLKTIDCAIIIDNDRLNATLDRSELASVPIVEDHMMLGVGTRVHQTHPSAHPQDYLTRLPVIYYSSEESTYLEEVFRQSVGQLAGTLNVQRVGSYEQMQLLVGMGKAVSFYPTELVKYMANPYDQITYLPLTGIVTRRSTFRLIYRRDNPHAVIQTMLAYFSQHHF